MVDGEISSITVLSDGGPSAMVDVTRIKGFFQQVLYSFSVTMANGELAPQYDPRQMITPYIRDVFNSA